MDALAAVAGAGFLILVLGFGIGTVRDMVNRRKAEWTRAAASLGLSEPARGFFRTTAQELEGTIDGLEVTVKGHAGKGARTVYEMAQPIASFTLTAEGMGSAVGKWIGGDDVRTGDPAFDALALLRGEEAEQRSLYDAETRAAASRLLALGGWATDGKIRIESRRLDERASQIEERVDAMAALARRLAWAHRTPPSERLAAIAAKDPLPDVRRNALTSLLSRAARDRLPHALVDGAITAALADPDPAIRLFAATSGRAERGKARATMVELVRNAKTPDALRAKTVGILGDFEGIEDADGILGSLLSTEGNETLVAALDSAALRGIDGARVAAFTTRAHPPVRAAAARALGRVGGRDAQPALVRLLEDVDDPVRLAAIAALALVGDVSAVEKLLPLTQGVFVAGDVKRAAQSAISSIQSRIAGAGAGQLTVSDAPPDAGALSSPATGKEGELSEVPDPRPRKTPA